MKTHSILTTEAHVCTIEGCSKSFSEKLGLSLHIRSAHREDNSKFYCEHEGCNKSYCNKVSLTRHLKVHLKSPDLQQEEISSDDEDNENMEDEEDVDDEDRGDNEKEVIQKKTRVTDIFSALGFIPESPFKEQQVLV